jgi:hypothetical protein
VMRKIRFKRYGMLYGSWWAFQWYFKGWVSLGVHVDFRCRLNQRSQVRYGPYIDLHLLCVIVSIGRNPAYSGELEMLIPGGRYGIN